MSCDRSEAGSSDLQTDASKGSPQAEAKSVRESEIWTVLASSEMSKRLGCDQSELESIIERIAATFEIDRVDQLQAIPEHILLRHNVPAAFCQLIREVKAPSSLDSSLSEVERYLWLHGLDAGLSPDEIKRAVTCIVDVNWMASIDALRRLPRNQWSRLGLPDSIVTRKIQGLVDRADDKEAARATSISLLELLRVVGRRVGKSEACTDALAFRLAREHAIETLEDLSIMTDLAFQSLQMPLAIANELDSIRRRPERVNQGGDLEEDTEKSEYAEPDAETLIKKIGKCFNHPPEEVRMVVDVLVKQHWINTTAKMRQLTPQHWEEFYLSAAFVADIKKALTDPVMLGMTAVNTSAPPLDLFPCDVEFAIDALYDELQECDKREVCRSFMRLFEFLLSKPEDASKRVIRKANPNFLRSAKYESVKLLLHSLGYVDYDTHYLLPVLYTQRFETAHERLAAVACKIFTPQESGLALLRPASALRPLWEPTNYANVLKDSEIFFSNLGPSVRTFLGLSQDAPST